MGEPVVIEGFHKHDAWETEMCKKTGNANRPAATTDMNGPKKLKRPSGTPLVRASCKMFKASLTSTTRKPKARVTPLASALRAKNMTDITMLRKEQEAA